MLSKILIGVIALIALFLIVFTYKSYSSKSGKVPGTVNGQLQQCPDTPNCICTEYPDDSDHFHMPIKLDSNELNSIQKISIRIIEKMGGSIVENQPNYLASTFTSKIFGFVDDFEIRIDTLQTQLHLRSASRVGHSDMGVNLKRVNHFVELLSKEN